MLFFFLLEPIGKINYECAKNNTSKIHALNTLYFPFQDPTIFGGSVRRNLDPGTRYSDAALWRALGAVLLRDKVRRLPGRLYADLAEHGAHFTLGERQLLSLARAILRNSKVVVFEESCSVLDKR